MTPVRISTTLACVAVVLIGAAACEGDDILPPGTATGSGTVASSVGVWQGHEEKVPVGTQTTVAVRVTDSLERPVPGVTVSFTTNSGTLGSDTATSDGNGIASISFTTSALAKADTINATIPGGRIPAQVVVDATAN